MDNDSYSEKKIRNTSGFTLIEVIISLLILSIIILALTPLFVTSIDYIFQAGRKSSTLYESQGIIDNQIVSYVYGSSDKLNLTFTSDSYEVWGRKLDVSLLTTFLSEPVARTRYVAVGESKTILTSPDGITWADKTPTDYFYDLRGITWGGSSPKRFVAVGTFGTIIVSAEGDTWDRVHDSVYHLNSVTWASTEWLRMFMAVGENGTILTSADGLTWNTQFTGAGNLHGVAFAETDDIGTAYFVVVGDGGTILTSQDGNTWTSYQNALWGNLRSVIWRSNMFIAVGDNGSLVTSSNAIDWTTHSGISNNLQSVTWGRSEVLAASLDGKIFNITDPTAPVENYSDGSQLRGITWSYNKYVAVGSSVASGRIIASDDGVTWDAQTLPVTNHLYGIAGR